MSLHGRPRPCRGSAGKPALGVMSLAWGYFFNGVFATDIALLPLVPPHRCKQLRKERTHALHNCGLPRCLEAQRRQEGRAWQRGRGSRRSR